jgi:hypothetical protein
VAADRRDRAGDDGAGIRLASDLAAPGYHLNRRDKIVLESKESMAKRNVASPDDGDALALTFAQPVAVAKFQKRRDRAVA